MGAVIPTTQSSLNAEQATDLEAGVTAGTKAALYVGMI